MRRWIVAATVVAMLAAGSIAAFALTGSAGSKLDQQNGWFETSPVTTSSTAWQNVPGLDDIGVCIVNELSAMLSVSASGAPIGLRISLDDGTLLQPGQIRFTPAGDPDESSFTFLEQKQNSVVGIKVQFRSPTGAATTLNKAAVNFLYQDGVCG